MYNINDGISTFYGFDTYPIYNVDREFIFSPNASSYWVENYPIRAYSVFLLNTYGITGDRYGDVHFEDLFEDHPELLDTAKKVYVHKDCKLSRTLVQGKYKKSLSPYTADAVVIPDCSEAACSMPKYAVFINDEPSLICVVRYHDLKEYDFFNANKGKTLGSLLRPEYLPWFEKFPGRLDATLEYVGSVIRIPQKYQYIIDSLTNTLPKDKLVFEKTMQKSLCYEDNKITFENLISIHEMLKSNDENTQAAGMKALSMMDYMHYTNSIKLMFSQMAAWEWRSNKANSSTSVKFMLKSIFGERWRRGLVYYNDTIYPQDLELFKKLLVHYEKIGEGEINNRMAGLKFMTVNQDSMLVPRLETSV